MANRKKKEAPATLPGPFNDSSGEPLWLFRQLPVDTVFTATNARSNLYGVWAMKTDAFACRVICPVEEGGLCNAGAVFNVSRLTVVRISDMEKKRYLSTLK